MESDPREASDILHDSYMMMPQLLSGTNGNSTHAYARPTRSTLELPSNVEESSPKVNQNPQQMLHPIVVIFRKQELGRNILVLAIPMNIALITLYNQVNAPTIVCFLSLALSVGAAGIWNGILLRKTFPRASKWIELLGVAFVLLTFYGFVGLALPNKTLIWIPSLCWLLNLLPFVIALCSRVRVPENGDSV